MSLLILFQSQGVSPSESLGGHFVEPVSEYQIREYWQNKRKKAVLALKKIEQEPEKKQETKKKRRKKKESTPHIDYRSLQESIKLIDAALESLSLALERSNAIEGQFRLLNALDERRRQAHAIHLTELEAYFLEQVSKAKKEKEEEDDLILLALLL